MNLNIEKVTDLEIQLIIKHITDLDKKHGELNILNKAKRSIDATTSQMNEECKNKIKIICEKIEYDIDAIRRRDYKGVENELTRIERIIQETDKNDPTHMAYKIIHYYICKNILPEKFNEINEQHLNTNSLEEDFKTSQLMPLSAKDILSSIYDDDDDFTSFPFDIPIPEEPKDAITIINNTISNAKRIERLINIFQNVVKYIVVPKEPLKPLPKQIQEQLQEQLQENFFIKNQIKLQEQLQKQREQLQEQMLESPQEQQETQELREKILREQTQIQEQMQQPLNDILRTILELLILILYKLQEIPQKLQKQIGESPQLQQELRNKLQQLLQELQQMQKQIFQTLKELHEQTPKLSQELQERLNKINKLPQELQEQIQKLPQELQEQLQELPQELQEQLKKLSQELQIQIQKLSQELQYQKYKRMNEKLELPYASFEEFKQFFLHDQSQFIIFSLI